MLLWVARVLVGAAVAPRHERQRAQRMSLAYLTWRAKALIVSRAIDFMPSRRRMHAAPTHRFKLKAGTIRALVGASICRRLKQRGVLDRVFALIDVLRDIDAHARSLARRLKRGLSRRAQSRRAKPMAVAALPTPALRAAFCTDSS